MKQILIAFVSHSGSTREIAQFISDEFSTQGYSVDVRPVSEISDLSPYPFILAGGLLYRFGWHPEIVRFLQTNLLALQQKKVALFVTGMHLAQTPRDDQHSYPVFYDPSMTNPVWKLGRATLFDRGATIDAYLRSALLTVEKIKPVSLGFFAGKLDLRTLKLPEQLIMRLLMLLTGMKTGDYRNWDSLRAWAKSLVPFAAMSENHRVLRE